jgi:hypothetical protein
MEDDEMLEMAWPDPLSLCAHLVYVELSDWDRNWSRNEARDKLRGWLAAVSLRLQQTGTEYQRRAMPRRAVHNFVVGSDDVRLLDVLADGNALGFVRVDASFLQ